MSPRLVDRASIDPEQRRQAAEERIRAIALEFADAVIALAAATPAPAQPIELIDIATAARRLGLARSSLYAALGRGEVRAIRIGGRVHISSSEIERICEGREPERQQASGLRRVAKIGSGNGEA